MSMLRETSRRFALAALALLAALGSAGGAQAQGWRWSVTPYMWASEVGVDVSVNDQEILEREADLADVLDALDFVLQAHVEGQKAKHGVLFDLTYIDMGDDDHRFQLGGPLGGEVVVKGDLEMTILEVGGIFNPQGDGTGFALLYGGRVLDFDEELDARFDFGPGSTPSRRYSASTTLVDGMIGARVLHPIDERWSYLLRADVSSGGTELTWNAQTGFGYAFGATKNKTLFLGYRYMEIELDEADRRAEIEIQNKLGGFIAGLKFAL